MLKLKLAEYDLKTGKFLRFLELGTDFGYFGNYLINNDIILSGHRVLSDEERSTIHLRKEGLAFIAAKYLKDKTDPLNRLNGLFNGRTYGEGRFVLIVNDQDFFIEPAIQIIHSQFKNGGLAIETVRAEKNFNIHENPELYEKIK